MKMTTLIFLLVGIILFILAGGAALVAFTAPKAPPMMESIAAPFRTMNFTTLPPVSYYLARDGAKLAYRSYPAAKAKQAIVLIHGSSGSSISMHALAQYLQRKNMNVYALDLRGHGESGRKGDIDYVGQLEDDLEDFRNQLFKVEKDVTLVGLSAGGGFVLRFAGSNRQKYFNRYVSIAPFIRYDAPTTRPNNGEWAKASVPRIICITMLGAIGQKWLGYLPVVAFGINPQTAQYQTASYSYRLWSNFGLHYNYSDDLKAIKQPLKVLVGANDELFYPQKYQPIFTQYQQHPEIKIVPGVGHITITTEPSGLSAIAEAVLH
jgi:pimeloyl-ACP methyl ester carboxylesterase